MRIYLPTGKRNHIMFVTPGNDAPETSDFFHPDGTKKQYTVRFVDGRVDVPAPLGRYMVAKKLAQTSSIILPGVERKLAVQEERVRNHRVIGTGYHHDEIAKTA